MDTQKSRSEQAIPAKGASVTVFDGDISEMCSVTQLLSIVDGMCHTPEDFDRLDEKATYGAKTQGT